MRKFCAALILPMALAALMTPAQAQYFKFDNMSQQDIDNGVPQLQVESIVKFFGSLVGSGLYHTADLHSVGGFDFGLRGVVTSIPDDIEILPAFIDESRVGLAFLHGSLGLPGNFEVLGRFFYFPLGSDIDLNVSPQRASDSRGGITLIGAGVKYGLLQLPGIPKITVLGAYHALITPNEFDFGTVSTFSFKGIVSHSLPLLTVYVGAGFDITSLKVNEDLPIAIPEIAGKRFTENDFQYTIGAKVQVLPFVFANGSANFGDFNSFDLGLGLGFR